MLFTQLRNIPLKLNIMIDNESIGEVRRTKFLGVFIELEGAYILYIWKKSQEWIGMIIKARNYLNQDGVLALHHAIIYIFHVL